MTWNRETSPGTKGAIKAAEATWKQCAESMGYKSEREMLHDLYHVQGKSLDEMEDELGFGAATVRFRMERLGIPRRKCGRRKGI